MEGECATDTVPTKSLSDLLSESAEVARAANASLEALVAQAADELAGKICAIQRMQTKEEEIAKLTRENPRR